MVCRQRAAEGAFGACTVSGNGAELSVLQHCVITQVDVWKSEKRNEISVSGRGKSPKMLWKTMRRVTNVANVIFFCVFFILLFVFLLLFFQNEVTQRYRCTSGSELKE